MCYRKLLLQDLISVWQWPFSPKNCTQKKRAISDNKAFQFMISSFIKILNNISTAIKFYLHFYETNKNNLKDIRRIDPTEYLFKLTIITVIKLCVCVPDSSHIYWGYGQCKYLGQGFYDIFRTFLPSSSCVPCARTLSTLAGSEKVMNPNPLEGERKKKKFCECLRQPKQLAFH
jgi:hypothetical protein